MKKEILNCFSYLINKLSECYVYDNWSDDLKVKELNLGFDTVYDELKKHIDFTKLTLEEAKELRFKKWDEDMPDLWLFPLYLVPIIPEGLEVTSINGETFKYEKDKMDNDIRFGCVAYGIEIKEEQPSCTTCGKKFVEGDICHNVKDSETVYTYCEECYQNKQ